MKFPLIIAISMLAGSFMASCTADNTSKKISEDTPFTMQEMAFATVASPDIPDTLEFCGQKVPLDREDLWERYDRELSSIIYGHTNALLIIKRANKYFPVMAPILEKHNIPLDLLYLACVESHLSHRAYSSAKAAGIWQFIPSTAKQYDLEVNDEIDERLNLEKSTEAACKYLKSSFNKYGNWGLVMASYNGGPGRISKTLDQQMGTSFFDIYLTEETARYVFRIMAMKEIMDHPYEYGYALKKNHLYQPTECNIVEVSGPVANWAVWARDHGINYAQLREENPWIRSIKLTNKQKKTYKVKVPLQKSLSRSQQEKTVFNPAWILD